MDEAQAVPMTQKDFDPARKIKKLRRILIISLLILALLMILFFFLYFLFPNLQFSPEDSMAETNELPQSEENQQPIITEEERRSKYLEGLDLLPYEKLDDGKRAGVFAPLVIFEDFENAAYTNGIVILIVAVGIYLFVKIRNRKEKKLTKTRKKSRPTKKRKNRKKG